MNILQHNEEFGIMLYWAYNYKHEQVYVVIYGLQVEKYTDKRKAYDEFMYCVQHAIDCS